MDRIKRLSNELLNEYSERFGTDFSTNKQTLNEISIIRSKGLKNEIAGYITKILLREEKFQARKQKLIDDEKKFIEKSKSQQKEPTPEPETIDAGDTIEKAEDVIQETEQKTLAEEVLDSVEKPEEKS